MSDPAPSAWQEARDATLRAAKKYEKKYNHRYDRAEHVHVLGPLDNEDLARRVIGRDAKQMTARYDPDRVGFVKSLMDEETGAPLFLMGMALPVVIGLAWLLDVWLMALVPVVVVLVTTTVLIRGVSKVALSLTRDETRRVTASVRTFPVHTLCQEGHSTAESGLMKMAAEAAEEMGRHRVYQSDAFAAERGDFDPRTELEGVSAACVALHHMRTRIESGAVTRAEKDEYRTALTATAGHVTALRAYLDALDETEFLMDVSASPVKQRPGAAARMRVVRAARDGEVSALRVIESAAGVEVMRARALAQSAFMVANHVPDNPYPIDDL